MTLSPPPIITVSAAMRRAIALMERFAPTPLPILLVGATGTGKELFARHIHYCSQRRGELVDVNCGALPHDMAESLLFGHRRGAFTGAIESVTGHLERADQGTLFLDEVLHLSAACQIKLLRALETCEVQPLGESRKRRSDFRIVAAAQGEVVHQVEHGAFRSDLFHRLAGIVITLPSLRERPKDIVPLSQHFAAQQNRTLEPGAEQVLLEHTWPGNVRELRLAIERAGCLADDGTLASRQIREAIALGASSGDRSGLNGYNGARGPAAELLSVCNAHDWDTTSVATSLGVARSTVYARLKRAGVSIRAAKKGSNGQDSELHDSIENSIVIQNSRTGLIDASPLLT